METLSFKHLRSFKQVKLSLTTELPSWIKGHKKESRWRASSPISLFKSVILRLLSLSLDVPANWLRARLSEVLGSLGLLEGQVARVLELLVRPEGPKKTHPIDL